MISSPHSVHELVEVVRSWAFQTPPSHRPQAVDDALAGIKEQLEAAREAVQACYDDLQRYAPPHWRNQGKGEILARNFLTSNPATSSEPSNSQRSRLDVGLSNQDAGTHEGGSDVSSPASGLHALTTADAENEPVDVRTDDDFEV
jgi:hypothetical protein